MLEDPKRSLHIDNAGGSSDVSEALSMQYMHIVHGATYFVPEMEVAYWICYKIADYLMVIGGENVGVSVTRAVSHPIGQPYTIERARELVTRKLYGLIVAGDCVAEESSFSKSILHVWCHTREAAKMIVQAHKEVADKEMLLPPEQRTYDEILLICTVCDLECIYTNHPHPRPPKGSSSSISSPPLDTCISCTCQTCPEA